MQAAYPPLRADSGPGVIWRRWLCATTPEAPPESSSWAVRNSARRARLVSAFATLTGLGYALVLLIVRIAEPSLTWLPLLAPIAACAVALMLNRAGRGTLATAVFLIPGLAVNLWICTGEGQSIGIDGIFGFHWLILTTLIATMLMPRWVPYAFALAMGVTVGVLAAYIPLAPDLRAAIAAQGLLATKSWIGFVWGLYYCLFFCVGALMGHVATTTLERAVKQADRTEEVEALHALSERRRRQAEEAERALRSSEARLRTVVDHAPIVLSAFDTTGTCILSEGRGLEKLSLARGAAAGMRLDALFADQPAILDAAARALAGEASMAVATVAGTVFETHYLPLRDADDASGAISGLVAVSTDVTARVRLEEQLTHAARHDSLTGLPNRAFFNEQLEHLVRSSAQAGSPLCTLLLDLDRFKEVNDTLGHHAGDELLREVAARLRGSLRATDLAARLGGDEFAIALPDTSAGDAAVVARTLLTVLAVPIKIEGRKMEAGCSIGIAAYPEYEGDWADQPERDADMDGTTLLRRADAAMYTAKRRGGGYAVHNADAPDAACQAQPEGIRAPATGRDAA